MKGNPRSETEVVRSTYVISDTLSDFWRLYAFRTHVVSDFWVSTFRFLNM